MPDRGWLGAFPLFFQRCRGRGWLGAFPLFFRRRRVVGGGWRVRRPPHPLRPARCRCRVRVGVGLGCGRPAREKRAAKTRTALPAFLRKDPFAFLLHFAACRAETLLRGDACPMGCLMDDWYGERRALASRFLSPEPLSCSAERRNGLRSGNGVESWRASCFLSPEPLSCSAERRNGLRGGNGVESWKASCFLSPAPLSCPVARWNALRRQ